MKHIENIAVIDIGSNSIRLLIGTFQNKTIKRVCSDRVVTKLGKNLIYTKKLNSEAIDKSIDIINKFKALAEKYEANIIIPIGTSVLREAEDCLIFCENVSKITGLHIKIITGDEEAFYTLEGIKLGLSLYRDFIATDIGGGSTEWIYEKNNNIFKGSLSIGALKVSIDLTNNGFFDVNEIRNFKRHINHLIYNNLPKINFKYLISTGGTSVTLGIINLKLDRYIPEIIHGHTISFDKLKQIVEKIIKTPYKEIKNIPGISPDRVDIIIPGFIIIESLMEYLKTDYLVISDYGLMEGIMKNYKNFCYNSTK